MADYLMMTEYRMRCLEQAIKLNGGSVNDPDNIITAAKKLFDFVAEGIVSPEPDTTDEIKRKQAELDDALKPSVQTLNVRS